MMWQNRLGPNHFLASIILEDLFYFNHKEPKKTMDITYQSGRVPLMATEPKNQPDNPSVNLILVIIMFIKFTVQKCT